MVLQWYKLANSNSNHFYICVRMGLALIMGWGTTCSSQKPLQQMSFLIYIAVWPVCSKSKLQIPAALDSALVRGEVQDHPTLHIHSLPALLQLDDLWVWGHVGCILEIYKICFPFSTVFISRWPQRRCENFCFPLALWMHTLPKSQSTDNTCSK